MPGVFTVFNIGTGHTKVETNNTFTDLHRTCADANKFINDGPVGGGVVAGAGMDRRGKKAVDEILKAGPQTVNLTGHSRGAVLCHMIANDLAESKDPAARRISEINMILLDPVNMSNHVCRGKTLGKTVNLGSYVSIVMENAGTVIYPSATVKPLRDQFRSRMVFQHLPGTHGSGTQCNSSAIGAARAMIRMHLQSWGTFFHGPRTTALDAAECFARIRVEHAVKYDAKGLIRARHISDNADGMARSKDDPAHAVNWNWAKVAGGRMNNRVATITANFEAMTAKGGHGAATDYRNSPYFINTFHAGCFREAFPKIFNLFCKGKAEYDRNVPADDLSDELAAIDRTTYIRQSLEQLGMI